MWAQRGRVFAGGECPSLGVSRRRAQTRLSDLLESQACANEAVRSARVAGVRGQSRSRIRTGDAARESRETKPLRSMLANWRTPVGQACTHAEQRTHSGSRIGSPRCAVAITSMPMWQTLVHTLHEMHFGLSATMAKREKRA